MFIKLSNGTISRLNSVYQEGNKICFVLYDNTVATKEFSTEEAVRYKLTNVEKHFTSKILLIDIEHL